MKKSLCLKNVVMLVGLALALGSPAARMSAQSAVTLALDAKAPGPAIPADFSGLSFETEKILPEKDGRYYFRPENRPLIDLFHTLGIKILRIGGNTADNPDVEIPTEADIDSLFAFAHAADVQVVYTVRLRGSDDPAPAAHIAKYVMEHYKSNLACLAIGNEPNVYFRAYLTYHEAWAEFMAAMTAPDAAPSAVFCGPSTTPDKGAWAANFAQDFVSTGRITFVGQHSYPCGNGKKMTNPVAGREKLLAADLPNSYSKLYGMFVPAVLASGLPYRLEETNNYYNGGAKDVSDTFASALWGLDYMWWWAAHAAVGLNFHTGDNVAAGDNSAVCRYAVFVTSPAGYAVHPLGYAMKAFDLGSHGRLVPLHIKMNSDHLNFTAYSVLASDGALYVTFINKEHGVNARAAAVTLAPDGAYARGETLFLTAPGGDVAAKSGELLGGSSIDDAANWRGAWAPLAAPAADGTFMIKVPAATAVVVRLSAE
jgi:hypothetical protein